MVDTALWVAFPYLAIGVFVLGHLWRYHQDRFGWTDASMQLFKPRAARWGIVLFHAGTFAVIAGHIVGILVPKWVAAHLGVSEAMYRMTAITLGAVFGLCAVAGLGALLWRRTIVPQIVANTIWIDLVTLGVLAVVIVLGMIETLGVNLVGGGYDYRSTVAVWYRGVLALSPHPELMVSAPLVYQLHAITAWLVLIVWPFSRLVHVWYFPFYVRRWLMSRRRDRTAVL
jgi:nitrate reductase gamma subunit